MKATTTGRSGRGKIAAALVAIGALTAGFFVFASNAFAHHPVVTGVSVCEENGTFTVNWEVGNTESVASHYMMVRAYSVTPDVGTTTGLTADGAYEGIVGPGYAGPGTVVAPSGVVSATTTGIPSGTTSVTLTVTGRWAYPSGPDVNGAIQTASYTVQLGGECEPQTGSLSISKVVTGDTAPADATYTINYDDGDGTSGSVTVQAGETATVADLPYGSYTLSEVNAPAGATISPNPAVVGPDTPEVEVTVTNPYPNAGGFAVTKQVTGAVDGYVAGSTFTVAYDCDDGTEGTLLLDDGGSEAVGGLPVGTECELAETEKPSTSGPSYVYGPESFSPSNVVTIVENDDDNIVQVTLTNPIERRLGAIEVSKDLSGATDGYVDGSTFGFTLDCPGTEFDESFSLEAGETASFGDIPLGTTCTVAEVSVPEPIEGYAYRTPVLTPDDGSVTVNSSTVPVTVTVDNPLVRLPAPEASIVNDCESGGALVTLTNDGGGEVVFQIVVDGEDFGPTHTVGPDGETTVLVPLDEDQTATITVEADGFGILTEQVVTLDCQEPAASFEVDCAEGGVLVTLTNDGPSPVELTIIKDGEVIDTVEVGDTPVEVLVPMDEDQTSTITVMDGDDVVDEQEITYDCTPEPTSTVPEATSTVPEATSTVPEDGSSTSVTVLGTSETPSTLPRTGANVFGLVAVAAGLMLGGASLIGIARRRS